VASDGSESRRRRVDPPLTSLHSVSVDPHGAALRDRVVRLDDRHRAHEPPLGRCRTECVWCGCPTIPGSTASLRLQNQNDSVFIPRPSASTSWLTPVSNKDSAQSAHTPASRSRALGRTHRQPEDLSVCSPRFGAARCHRRAAESGTPAHTHRAASLLLQHRKEPNACRSRRRAPAAALHRIRENAVLRARTTSSTVLASSSPTYRSISSGGRCESACMERAVSLDADTRSSAATARRRPRRARSIVTSGDVTAGVTRAARNPRRLATGRASAPWRSSRDACRSTRLAIGAGDHALLRHGRSRGPRQPVGRYPPHLTAAVTSRK